MSADDPMSGQTMAALADVPALFAALAGSLGAAGYDVRLMMPAEPPPLDLVRTATAALRRPVGTPALAELASGKRSAVIVTSDATRAVPNRELLPLVLAELRAGGIGAEDVTILIALGAHRPLTTAEVAELLGPEAAGLKVVNHDPFGPCVPVGTTSGGNSVSVARVFHEAELRIALGLVEPHEFAGFTGGGKSVLPGVAGHDAIIRNHGLELLRRAGSRPGEMAGNPIRREMDEAARLAGLHFILNVVLDRRLRPLAVAAGDPWQAHAELVRFIDGYARVPPPADVEHPDVPPDMLLTAPGRPLDINLYQSVKALVAVEPWVGQTTTTVLFSRCWDGDGSRDMIDAFRGGGTLRKVLERLEREYTIEKDHSYFITRFLSRCPHVIACCPGVATGTLATIGFAPAASVEDAVSQATAQATAGSPRPHRRSRPLAVLFPSPQRFVLAPLDGEHEAVLV